jgi:hypothetical protein
MTDHIAQMPNTPAHGQLVTLILSWRYDRHCSLHEIFWRLTARIVAGWDEEAVRGAMESCAPLIRDEEYD